MTFISNSQQFIFVHLHKCGGTSVERALGDRLMWNDVMLGSSPYGEQLQQLYKPKFGLDKHSSAADIKALVGDELWDSYFTFATVRHPFDRIVSYYSYIKTFYINFYRGSVIRLMYQLDQMNLVTPAMTKVPKLYDSFRWPGVIAGLKSRSISEFIHLDECWASNGTIPQFYRLSDSAGTALIVDYVSRLEDLNDNWAYICEKTGTSRPLPRANKSKRKYKDWRKYFSLEDINFLEEKYKADLARFDYTI